MARITRIIFSILLYLVEYLIAFNYFKKIFEYKSSCNKSIVIVGLNYLAIMLIYVINPNIEWLNVLLFAIANYLAICFGFHSNQKSAIFHSLILSLVMYITEMVTIFTISVLFNKSVIHYQNDF